MTQRNVAFITGQTPQGEALEATLLEQAERFVRQGRRNLVLVLDTFLDLEHVSMSAIACLAYRVEELQAELTCVALNERAIATMRTHPTLRSMRIIQRVDQIRAVA
jgi:hypothetical protein